MNNQHYLIKRQPTQPSTFAIRTSQPANQKLQKSLSVFHRTDGQTMQQKMNITTDKKEYRSDNITYTQAGVSCFVGQESSKFKVQFFVGSLVVIIPACV
jgi:hypothetical protein